MISSVTLDDKNNVIPDETLHDFAYRLTWPATTPAVCTVADQWRRNEQGEIEAWYTAEQLREVLITIQAARAAGAGA